MQLADRYAELLGSCLREQAQLPLPREYSELELQAHWFSGEFGRSFRGTAGERIEIVQFGVWNREAGPDFAEVAVTIDGGAPRRGALEFDMDARDWERHGHARNGAYENVVLHVFTRCGEAEFFTRTAAHRQVPQVLLDLASFTLAPPNSTPQATLGRCAGPLGAIANEKARDVLLGAAEHRLRRKVSALAQLVELHGMDEAIYQLLAGALGYKSNKLPFALLAQRLPLRLLAGKKEEADSLLFGLSGFLPKTDLTQFAPETRLYLQGLWERWWSRRAEFARLHLTPDLWTLSGQRPANHPQRRLAALGQIVRHWPSVRKLVRDFNPAAVGEFFATLSDPYWDVHFTVSSKAATRPMALVGEGRVMDIISNVFVPAAVLQSGAIPDGYRSLRAPAANKKAEIAAQRLFGQTTTGHEFLRTAALQQGLLQVYEDFCMQDASDCARCRFPRQLEQWT